MNVTEAQIWEIAAALVLSFLGVLLSHKAPVRIILIVLIGLIPFQLVDTRFGSLNVALAFFVLVSLWSRRQLASMPVPMGLGLLFLGYLLSFTQVHPVQTWDHVFYLISLLSAFAVMIVVYNCARHAPDYRYLINIQYVLNGLVLGYCVLQIFADRGGRLSLPGFDLQLVPARGDGDNRLAGPFGSTMPGLLAEYIVISILFLLYDLLLNLRTRRRSWLFVLIAANLGALVATGNRGGIIGLVLFSALLLLLLRRELGFGRIVKIGISAVLLFALATFVIINFTQYDRLFDRLVATEIEGGVPDTRAKTWPAAFAMFEEKPWLGHGPRLRLWQDDEIAYPDHRVIEFPHNLFLYLLCTIGIVGVICYLVFFVSLYWRLLQARPGSGADLYLHFWPRFAMLLLSYVLFDQMKIEFSRFTAVDYWHYLFMLFGLLLGIAHRDLSRKQAASRKAEYRIVQHRVTAA